MAHARFACLALAATLPLTAARAQQVQEHAVGTAYARGSDRVVYREEHWLYRDQGQARRLVLYRCASGEAFARKQLATPGPDWAPDFSYEDGRDGYQEGLRSAQGRRQVYVRKRRGAEERTAEIALPPEAVVDAGFDAYVRQHWAQVSDPAGARVPFLVPSRLGLINLKIRGAGDSQLDGVPVRRLRMSLDAWFGFALPPIELTYTLDGHRLRRFEGLSNVHDASGGNQTVRIDFLPRDATPATAESLQDALKTALVSHCPG